MSKIYFIRHAKAAQKMLQESLARKAKRTLNLWLAG